MKMLTGYYKFLFTCFPVLATPALADFLPPNDLHLEDSLLRDANLTKADFNGVIDQAEAIYGPILKSQHGATLNVSRLWDSNTVNASAMQFGNTWYVNMYGGLARRPEVTLDGFTLVLCHELGHHLAGYPFSAAWAANEGQSDYFATQSCARELWKESRSKNAEARELIPDLPKAQCDSVWKTEDEQNLCYRLMLASKSIGDLAAAVSNKSVAWDSPDTKAVTQTYNGHPQSQCRLDTMMAGALCNLAFDMKLIPGKDLGSKRNGPEAELMSAKHTCTQYMKHEIGYRPACWFKSTL
jgi:hypothetical protein